MKRPTEGSTPGPANDSAKMRDEIRSKLESDIDSALKDVQNRVRPPAQPAERQDGPTVAGVCSACGGSGRCQVCHGRGCGYCKAGMCGSCNGQGAV